MLLHPISFDPRQPYCSGSSLVFRKYCAILCKTTATRRTNTARITVSKTPKVKCCKCKTQGKVGWCLKGNHHLAMKKQKNLQLQGALNLWQCKMDVK